MTDTGVGGFYVNDSYPYVYQGVGGCLLNSGGQLFFNLGNNNALTRTQVAEVFAEVANQSQIIVVNTAVPRPWRDANNALISEFAAANPRAQVVDWATISQNRPDYFAPDGVHLRPAGIKVYVAAILEALNK
jgi:hypothetical protein